MGASKAPIRVTTGGGSAASPDSFKAGAAAPGGGGGRAVTIAAFTPSKGSAGTDVTVTGSGFTARPR